MRLVLALSIPLLILSACSSHSASTPAEPTATPYEQVISHNIPMSKPPKNATPFPTADPHATPAKLPTVKVYVPPKPKVWPASAYKSVIYGKVTDVQTHKPIPGAVVAVADGQRKTRSNAAGQYRVVFPSKAAVSFEVTKAHYTCGLAMGMLRPGETYHRNVPCQRIDPKHPVPPPFPTFFGQGR